MATQAWAHATPPQGSPPGRATLGFETMPRWGIAC